MSLVDTNWLEKNLDKVKIIDSSWHMSQTKRNGFAEYQDQKRLHFLYVTFDILQNHFSLFEACATSNQ